MTTNTISNATRASSFLMTLRGIIPPRDCSDRTSFRHAANWLALECDAGRFDADVFVRAIDLAKEAAGPQCRRPAAVFMSLLKKELGYSPKGSEK